MKAAILIMIGIYWLILGIFFSVQLQSPVTDQGFTARVNISEAIDLSEPTGFLVTDIFKILGIVLLGIGLPAGTPLFITIPYAMWSWLVTLTFLISLWA